MRILVAKKIKASPLRKRKLKNARIKGRVRWTEAQKKLVLYNLKKYIKKKIPSKKDECESLKRNSKLLDNLEWVKIKTFVYNACKNSYIVMYVVCNYMYTQHVPKWKNFFKIISPGGANYGSVYVTIVHFSLMFFQNLITFASIETEIFPFR